jgi:hypothetical protein
MKPNNMQGFNLKVMNITRLASETMRIACLDVWYLVSFRRFADSTSSDSHDVRGRTLRRFACFLVFFLTGFSVKAQLHFTDVTLKAGIYFQHEDGRSGEKYFLETLGAGAAWFDYDRDGDLDIYFVNGRDLPGMHSKIPPTNALYCNNGDGAFTDVTEKAGVEGDGYYGFSCAVGDYDNDGWKDLYVANFGHSILYHNNGDGTFADVTDRAGVGNDGRWAAAAAFADYNNDGELDLFVANYVDYRLEDNPVCGKGVRLHCSPNVFKGAPSVLYRNNGDGTFTSVTRQAGLDKIGKGMGVIWCDYDNDEDMDLFVANDRMPNYLYRNNGPPLTPPHAGGNGGGLLMWLYKRGLQSAKWESHKVTWRQSLGTLITMAGLTLS